ncbi:hypothetical protein BpHYR1_045826 [Brachionus plicatilis]|uniref:Uncharacterized protein n=1 Tax=Brachionus plicatilis TaxID=10195 RepID=A0A3M7RQL9_BRAPC|nr:hypothetical protein BpHYR1_045826 [Brachionus plicatilis]
MCQILKEYNIDQILNFDLEERIHQHFSKLKGITRYHSNLHGKTLINQNDYFSSKNVHLSFQIMHINFHLNIEFKIFIGIFSIQFLSSFSSLLINLFKNILKQIFNFTPKDLFFY